jgi:putative membrane protein
MMWGYGYDGSVWMWVVGGIVAVGIVVLIVVLARNSSRASVGAKMLPPRQILDERYARGELTTEEYRERIKTLDGTA